jgi:hypothetical protein
MQKRFKNRAYIYKKQWQNVKVIFKAVTCQKLMSKKKRKEKGKKKTSCEYFFLFLKILGGISCAKKDGGKGGLKSESKVKSF